MKRREEKRRGEGKVRARGGVSPKDRTGREVKSRQGKGREGEQRRDNGKKMNDKE